MSSVESEMRFITGRKMVVCFEVSSVMESKMLSATESAAPGPAKKQRLWGMDSPPCEIVGNALGITGDALAAYMAKHWPDEWF